MHQLTVNEWNLDSSLLFKTYCKQQIEVAKQIKDQSETVLDLLDAEKRLYFWLKSYKAANARVLSFLEQVEYSLTPYLNMLPKFKNMDKAEYKQISDKYYTLVNRQLELESVIHKTYCPVKLALFNEDMRLILAQKEEIFSLLIEK